VLLVVVFGLYVLWDFLKTLEYRAEYQDSAKWLRAYIGEFTSFIWFGVFLFLALAARSRWFLDTTLLVMAYVATIGHRINKVTPLWSDLGAWLAKTFIHGGQPPQP
jgi:hypothetical protein